jgi:hypothetical protein
MRPLMFSITLYEGDQLIYKQKDQDLPRVFHRFAVFIFKKYLGTDRKEA